MMYSIIYSRFWNTFNDIFHFTWVATRNNELYLNRMSFRRNQVPFPRCLLQSLYKVESAYLRDQEMLRIQYIRTGFAISYSSTFCKKIVCLPQNRDSCKAFHIALNNFLQVGPLYDV